MKKRIVHLDLKGAPPKPDVYGHLFELIHSLNFTGVLMEYEDTFPFTGRLSKLSLPYAYSEETIKRIQEVATSNSLDVIPLVQTFGHLEYALKNEEFAALREQPDKTDSICPSDVKSIELVKEMLHQVRHLHPHSKTIHVGADEAWWVGKDVRCLEKLENTFHGSIERLKLAHISSIATYAKKELGFECVLVWNDMFDNSPVELLREYGMHELVVPVVWGYVRDVNAPGYFAEGMFERYHQVFNAVMLAGAYKGANGENYQFADADRYLENLHSYHRLTTKFFPQLNSSLTGIILTGWQRYSHDRGLCELLPTGIPTLVKEAFFLDNWESVDDENPPDYTPRLLNLFQCPKGAGPDSVPAITYNEERFEYPALEWKLTHCTFFMSDLYREIEKLRVIAWKASVNINFREDKQLMGELDQLRRSVKSIMPKYYYDATVDEWTSSYLDPSNLRNISPTTLSGPSYSG